MKHHIRMLCAHMCVSTGMWGRTLLAIDQHVYVCSPTTIIEQENPKPSGMRVGHTVLENNRPSTILKTILYQQEKRIAQTGVDYCGSAGLTHTSAHMPRFVPTYYVLYKSTSNSTHILALARARDACVPAACRMYQMFR